MRNSSADFTLDIYSRTLLGDELLRTASSVLSYIVAAALCTTFAGVLLTLQLVTYSCIDNKTS